MSEKQKEESLPPTAQPAKHTTHTDALDTLGTILDGTAQRDAIHLAVEPCVAAVFLRPGQDVGRTANGEWSCFVKPTVGIVDPFLKNSVLPGQRFWLLVYPRQITSLRHVWEHPAFPAEPRPQFLTGMTVVEGSFKPAEVDPTIMGMYNQNRADSQKDSERWLRDWCDSNDAPRYETLMRIITGNDYGQDVHNDYVTGDVYEWAVSTFGGEWHAEIPNEFWDHVEVVTGQKQTKRPSGFSCSC